MEECEIFKLPLKKKKNDHLVAHCHGLANPWSWLLTHNSDTVVGLDVTHARSPNPWKGHH